jgi:hypothetical protein
MTPTVHQATEPASRFLCRAMERNMLEINTLQIAPLQIRRFPLRYLGYLLFNAC